MRLISLFILLFLLVACDNGKKEFETLKEEEILLDVNVEEYSLNGTVLGKTTTDISAIDDIIDKPLQKEICRVRTEFQKEILRRGGSTDGIDFAKLHVDENLSYGDFYKVFSSMFFCGYSSFNIAIGSNYKDAFHLGIPSTDYMWCGLVIQQMKGLRYKYLRNRQRLSLAEMIDMDIKDGKCVEDYEGLDLLLSLYRTNDGIAYVVSLNEAYFNKESRFDGYNFYTFNNDADLWTFIEDIRSRVERQIEKKPVTKQDRVLKLLVDVLNGPNKITLVFEKDVLMKDIAPVIKKLTSYGYKVSFAITGF